MSKGIILAVAATGLGLGIAVNGQVNPFQEVTAHAAIIKFQGKHYQSKYTVRQIRYKYHLTYQRQTFKVSKDVFNHVVRNQYVGIQRNPSIRRETKLPMFVTAHGTYAGFRSAYVEAAFNSKTAYVNLKTGKLVVSHNGWA
ncbi:hypothetical protein [Levilactobacillus acidifarinae]|uniref:Uncharacterized protein n=1 Tax=Levilactobacillus acidifarinae DSM 19394 = JCM 15949 TaxID=1423715 RepID=A0A0R1LRX6_9LACO|nr:hypothetical protein [Levilactobacillus acidifarinae]KRK95034.1 hypothetical protein FD25_GL002220 [Levilactobacillus acidifarinae DSM 19394]GEO70572.1 hypothetical protein LAC03_24820 [Levilactobacillus acidifarinae]